MNLRKIVGLCFVWMIGTAGAHAALSALSKEFQDYMVAHHYGAVSLDTDDSLPNSQSVDAVINGRKVTLVVDTGSSYTILNSECARRLKLDVQSTGRAAIAFGGKMSEPEGIALIQEFKLGGCDMNRTNTIHVFPKSGHASRCDGLLGLDYLRLNAAILPVAGSGFLVKPGPMPPVPIAAYMTKLGYTGVPLTCNGAVLLVDGHVNDHAMQFFVDSGASFSAFDVDFIRVVLGRDLTSAPLQMEGADRSTPDNYRFEAEELDVGGFKIPPILLMATKTAMFTDSHCQACLGYDLLGLHRGIIDLGGMTLWLK